MGTIDALTPQENPQFISPSVEAGDFLRVRLKIRDMSGHGMRTEKSREELINTDVAQEIDIVEGLARTENHGGKRIVHNGYGQLGFITQKGVESFQ